MNRNFSQYRILKKLTLKEVAQLMGIEVVQLQAWEAGENSPTLDQAMELCDIYEISLDQLVGQKGYQDKEEMPHQSQDWLERHWWKVLAILSMTAYLFNSIRL